MSSPNLNAVTHLVLDHGYVKFIEHWGSDERIIEAARQSTDKGFLGWGGPCSVCGGSGSLPEDHGQGMVEQLACQDCMGQGTVVGDEKLLRFLNEHHHDSPFEFAGMVIEVQAPIAVFREWHRHRTQSFNEMSGRYTVLPDLYYLPSLDRIMSGKQSSKNKQGSEGGFSEGEAYCFSDDIRAVYEHCRASYEWMLAKGVAREVARFVLPVGQYSRMRASANLRNWLAFLTLRQDESAQWEIRQFANFVGTLIAEKYPRTWTLFVERRDEWREFLEWKKNRNR